MYWMVHYSLTLGAAIHMGNKHIQTKDFTSFKREVTTDHLFDGKADITRPRVDIKPFQNPAAKLKELYGGNKTYLQHHPHDDGGYAPPKHSDWEYAPGNKINDHQSKQGPGYTNDVADDWRRGQGKKQAEGYPGFDPVGNPGRNKGGGALKATGKDGGMRSSPFSAANNDSPRDNSQSVKPAKLR